MKKTLLDKLLARIPQYNRPNNPRNKKGEKKDVKYLHISNQYFERANEAGVKYIQRVGITYRKG